MNEYKAAFILLVVLIGYLTLSPIVALALMNKPTVSFELWVAFGGFVLFAWAYLPIGASIVLAVLIILAWMCYKESKKV